MSDDVPETIGTYLRLRGLEPSPRGARRKKRALDDDDKQPFAPGRDPKGVADVLPTSPGSPDGTRSWRGRISSCSGRMSPARRPPATRIRSPSPTGFSPCSATRRRGRRTCS
jgi:hypothetical protein